MSFASLRKVVRSARKGLCSTCTKTRYPQLEAAGAGHVGCLIYTLETLGTLIKDEHDVTAMHVAARKGHISILIYLVENKLVDTIPRAKNFATPAHDAAGTGNLECLRYIITQTKASPNDVDSNNATPLHWAVQAGHLKVVQWLVIEGKAAIDTSARNGMTLLHQAASKNYLDIIRWLTMHIYKTHNKPRKLINAKDKNGATPIYHAARVGHVAVIQFLAEKGGGDPTIFTNHGMAPIHAAATTGQLEAVKYLFQFGSATAPGGLRTTQGASALHCAAAEGHMKIIEWLISSTNCTGNERDYYQGTPLHDAAENGHVRIIEFLFEKGADCFMADVEGNSAYDVAVKNGQTKAARTLSAIMKQKAASGKNGTVPARGLSRSKTSNAQMIDNYRNAPPHQLPVSVFEDDMNPYEEEEDDEASEGDEWTTLRDLMGDQEIKEMSSAQTLSNEEKKRRKLEEDMQKEKEARLRKRQELMKKEDEYEQEIRERILQEERQSEMAKEHRKAEQAYEAVEKDKKKRLSAPAAPKSWGTTAAAPAASRRITLPGSTSAHELSRDMIDRRGPGIDMPVTKEVKKKRWWSRKSSSSSTPQKMKTSKSWDSSVTTARYDDKDEEIDGDFESSIPDPPPLPTVEYLLGKKPVNLRKRMNQNLKDQLKERAASLKKSKDIDCGPFEDSDDESSSVASSRGSSKGRHRHRKGGKHKKRKKNEDEDGSGEWTHSKLAASSPSHSRKDHKSLDSPKRKAMERKPTPMPSKVPVSDILAGSSSIQQRLNFDALDEMNSVLEDALHSISPSSNSPLNSPSSQSTPSSSREASPLHTAATPSSQTQGGAASPSPRTTRNKRGGPKLPPHLQNKQVTQQSPNHPSQTSQPVSNPSQARQSPITKVGNRRNKSQQGATPPPSAGGRGPQLTRQQGQLESTSDPDLTIDDMELQLEEMKTRLAHTSANSMQGNNIRPPSPNTSEDEDEDDSESETDESTEYTSSSETTSSSDSDDSSDSSDEEVQMKKPMTPKRMNMVRNPVGGAGAKGRAGGGNATNRGFNRLRMLSRYPRLFRKKVINLDTIAEQAEEVLYEYDSTEDRAVIFHRLQVEKKYITAWRKYMSIMKAANKKADKILQRKRKETMAKVFYAWIQGRNMGAVDSEERADLYYRQRLIRRMYKAWRSLRPMEYGGMSNAPSLQQVNANERYLTWLNAQLEPALGKKVDNVGSSLSDGVLIVQAIAHASGAKSPKLHLKPKIRLHRQDNWKTAHSFMTSVGINVNGIEPADLANGMEAAIHNMFNAILKWHNSRQ